MKKELNISEILKGKPKGIRLYSPIFGDCTFSFIQGTTDAICVRIYNDNKEFFDYKGLYSTLGEVMLYPSRNMRDWSKFAWKKGDILVSNDGKVEIIFEKFRSDTYQSFIGKHHLDSIDDKNLHYQDEGEYSTFNFNIEIEDAAQTYINTIEERLGGKLNRDTLEVEKNHTEFKDGDIVAVDLERKNIRIFKEKENENNFCWGKYYIGFSFNNKGKLIQTFENYKADCASDRLATDEEKQKLFNCLAKKNKAWDAKKKAIVDLKPKVGFKPFDKVLVRNYYNEVWKCDFYNFGIGVTHSCMINGNFRQCIPYNEETAKLIGTTKDVED